MQAPGHTTTSQRHGPTLLAFGVIAGALALMIAGLVATAPEARADETFEVDTTDDTSTCDDDECSLRGAILEANDSPDDAATIVLEDETYPLTLAAGVDSGEYGDLEIASDITVQGAGQDETVIDANPLGQQYRVFTVHHGADLSLDGVQVTNGGTANDGGGTLVHGDASLTLEDSRVTGNMAGGNGGGIAVAAPSPAPEMTISEDSLVDENEAEGLGGGIALQALEGGISASISNSTISDNSAEAGGGIALLGLGDLSPELSLDGTVLEDNEASGPGGAVTNGVRHDGGLEPGGHIDVSNSAFRGNSATGGFASGGAIASFTPEDQESRTVEIAHSVFADNSSSGAGGALAQNGGQLSLLNTTVSGNSTDQHAAAIANQGSDDAAGSTLDLTHVTIADNVLEHGEPVAGVIANAEGEQVSLLATIIADNEATGGVNAPNCVGDITSLGDNLEDADTCDLGETGDLTDTDPDLDDLALNAPGDTETHALPSDSPAVEHMDGCGATDDQRGVSRPQGAACDIGAYEREVADPEVGLGVDKSAPNQVLVGDEFDYEIEVTNEGDVTAEGATLTDTLPAQVAFESVDPSGDCSEAGGEVTCDLGDLSPGESTTVTITVTAETQTSSATNEAIADSDTTDPAQDSEDVWIGFTTPCPADDFPTGTDRIAGDDRFDTAIETSEECYDDGEASAVVLTRADIFPDALSGTPLAVQEDAPLLFSMPERLHAGTAAELERVLPAGNNVYLLGQTAALSEEVEERVEELGYNAIRIGGADRYETATEIVEHGLNDPGALLLATGVDFPDPLAGATGEAIDGGVLLTRGERMADDTQDYLDSRTDDPDVYAMGGPAAEAAPDATPIVGADRYETAIDVAEEFFSSPESVGIATGGDFADALSGGVQLGKLGGPMLLVRQDALPPVVETYLEDRADDIERALIFGGPAAVSSDVEQAVEDAIDP
ncbi:cell wall-binding repeat-containing protein [Egibacter rhizosphaerae]|nr:cell wall-binding repeat-containing protein [Egibacter rhizosphaerae]